MEESDFKLGLTNENGCNDEVHFIEYIDYDVMDAKKKPQYPDPNDVFKGSRALRMYWGTDGYVNHKHLGDLRPADIDSKPSFFGGKKPRTRMVAYRVQTGLFQFVIPDVVVRTAMKSFLRAKLTLTLAWDLPGEYITGPDGTIQRNPSVGRGSRDELIDDEEDQMIQSWDELLLNNDTGREDANTKNEMLSPGSIYRVKYMTVGGIKNVIAGDIKARILDYFATMSDSEGFKTEEMDAMNDLIAENIMNIFNSDPFLRRRKLKVVTKPIFDHVETTQERQAREEMEARVRGIDDERRKKEMIQQFEMERLEHDIEYKKMVEEFEQAAKLAKAKVQAINAEFGE